MKLYDLFLHCTAAQYTHTERDGDFALERVGGTLYVYFQKSNGLADWQSNLNFPAAPVMRNGERVYLAHRGFLAVWQDVWPHIARDLLDATAEKIVITGYSHGAALAVLCHEQVWYARPDLRDSLEGYGFGCPRVFFGIPWPRITHRWDRFLVVRNLDDAVTHLPPVYLGFSHVGHMLTIGRKGAYSPTEAHEKENILRELRAAEQNGSLRIP